MKKHQILLKYVCITLIISVSIFQSLYSQNKYRVYFTDKKDVCFNPFEYFDQKAIERRIINGISLNDSTDFPVNQQYLDVITSLSDSVRFASRWFNCVTIYTSTEREETIKHLPFVKKVEIAEMHQVTISEKRNKEEDELLEFIDLKLLKTQTGIMQADSFFNHDIFGKNIRIAVFDVGFKDVDTHPAFEHLRDNNQIKLTHDFVKNKDFVYDYGTHGRMVLTCLTGFYAGKYFGLAKDAEFILARTERNNSEYFSEEEFWLAAAEWSDKNGADIISSSLGYAADRYFVAEMNGKKSFVSKAASMAAKKGILVVTAMGNEGDSEWKYIVTPADADSVLSVGGVEPFTGIHIDFSSFGPTSDFRIKPNVSAAGRAVVASSSDFTVSQGTSFSTPLIAGFAACVKQLKPELNTVSLIKEIETSGNLFPYFDYAHGFGIPQAGYFFKTSENDIPTFDISVENEELTVNIFNTFVKFQDKKYLFWHVEKNDGTLSYYSVVEVFSENPLKIDLFKYSNDKKIVFYYEGYILEHIINQ